MVRKIVWTSRAEAIFTKILQYYIERNGSKTFSRRILEEVKNILNLLKKYPYLGSTTEMQDIRVLVTRNYKLFYQIEGGKIIVILILDNRENPDNLKKLLG